jgi:mono/diheme cytochrome c family protein
MLPQLHLSTDQRWAVTRYLFTLIPPDLQTKTPEKVLVPAAPAAMPEQVEQGRALYADLGCASCHGDDGRGNIPAAAELRDYKDRPIAPTDLTLRPRKRSNSPEDLYSTLVTGINGTPMPAYADILPPEQMWTLVSYVAGLAVNPMPTADISGMGMGMMGMGRMGMMGMMPRRMGFVGEESIAMMVDMPAARAWKMGRRR